MSFAIERTDENWSASIEEKILLVKRWRAWLPWLDSPPNVLHSSGTIYILYRITILLDSIKLCNDETRHSLSQS